MKFSPLSILHQNNSKFDPRLFFDPLHIIRLCTAIPSIALQQCNDQPENEKLVNEESFLLIADFITQAMHVLAQRSLQFERQ